MNIFEGTVDFSRRTLEELMELNVNIAGIITKKLSRLHPFLRGEGILLVPCYTVGVEAGCKYAAGLSGQKELE